MGDGNRMMTVVRTRFSTVAILLLVTAALGCGRWQSVQKPVIGRGDARPGDASGGAVRPAGTAAQLALSKTVTGKEEPATLIAQDGTRCAVTAERYREIAIGERVRCVWTR